MANTEGISDEDLTKLLSIGTSDVTRPLSSSKSKNASSSSSNKIPRSSAKTRAPKALLDRQRMMDEFENGGDFKPSARVIRTKERPVIKRARSNIGEKNVVNSSADDPNENFLGPPSPGKNPEAEMDTTAGKNGNTNVGLPSANIPNITEKRVRVTPIIMSDSIQERQVKNINVPKKQSRFKMRQQQKNNANKQGFPSFDIPVGALTRKGIGMQSASKMTKGLQNSDGMRSRPIIQPPTQKNPNQSEADKMIAGMSMAEINESVSEIESLLSKDTIQFLKNRNRPRKALGDSKANQNVKSKTEVCTSIATITKQASMKEVGVGKRIPSMKEKEETAKLLSGIKTEEELDEAFIAQTMEKLSNNEIPVTINEDDEEPTSESELEAASKLLRSTASRQRILGAKNVCALLDGQVDGLMTKNGSSYWTETENSLVYPELLPVALRCILDTPSPQKHLQLISYVIRSIYNLVLIFSHPDHRINFRDFAEKEMGGNFDIIFQQDFMQDSVPTVDASESYSGEGKGQEEHNSLGHGCYATNASAESAKSDAKAFYADPAWVLLSKMRLIPCLSHILTSHARTKSHSINSDTITAICGILSILCLRSPGAAVAIAQHVDLIPSLISLTLEPGSGESNGFVVDTNLAFPTIFLSCTLCRQSRTAAKSLEAVVETVTYITADNATKYKEYRLQQWCIILWRSLLRYGLGFSHLSTILQISVPRLAVDSDSEFNLAPEYFSAYSVLCECVGIATMHNNFQSKADKEILCDSDREVLAMSGMWLSSHARNCSASLQDFECADLNRGLKLTCARLHFFSSYFDASSPSDIMGRGLVSKSLSFVPVIPLETFISVLQNIADSQVLSSCIEIAMGMNEDPANKKSLEIEAIACSFVETFYSSIKILTDKIKKFSTDREECKVSSSVDADVELFVNKVFSSTVLQLNKQPLSFLPAQKSRIRWINRTHSAISKFLSLALPSYVLASNPESVVAKLPLVQSFVFTLIGRLQRGEESIAAILLSQDIIFTILKEHSKDCAISNAQSVQDTMMKELCFTQRAQSQLDHSFKLYGRPGLTAEGKGHFGLESLRSETDARSPPTKSEGSGFQDDPNLLILPLGDDWLWKLVSSTIVIDENDKNNEEVLEKTIGIVNSSLEFLLYIEKSSMACKGMVEPGSKTYFLLNTCLLPEVIIRDEKFETLFLELYLMYEAEVVEAKSQNAKFFITTCYRHSSHFRKHALDGAEYDKVMNLFFNIESDDVDNSGISSRDLKAVDDFVEDLCDTFLVWGAQYKLFVHAIRFLLLPEMPLRLRAKVLNKMKNLLHLLSTESENEDASGNQLKSTLRHFYLGGLPYIDKSPRDKAPFLDLLSNLLRRGDFHLSQRRGGFFYYYAVGCLSRSLASSSVKCECGVNMMSRRMKGLDHHIWDDIVHTSKECIVKKCDTSYDLTNVVFHVCNQQAKSSIPREFEHVIQNLQALYESE